jgi:hypothetical protein
MLPLSNNGVMMPENGARDKLLQIFGIQKQVSKPFFKM